MSRRALALALALAAASAPRAARAAPVIAVPPAANGAAWSDAQIVKLRADLGRLLEADPAVRGAHVGLVVADAGTASVLYERNGADAFQPASTLKLLVGSVALERLGPAMQFVTTVRDDATSADRFDLRLVAGGDPFLTTADLQAAAAAIVRAEPDRTSIALTVDTATLEAAPYPRGWVWDDFGEDYAPHVGAMILDENVVHVRVSPGPGAPRYEVVSPPGLAPPIDLRLLASGRCDPAAGYAQVRTLANLGAPGSDSTLDAVAGDGGCPAIVGAIAPDAASETLDVAVDDPVVYARRAFLEALLARAPLLTEAVPAPVVVVAGVPARLVYEHRSPTLAAFLGPRFWIPSDNLVAEILLRTLDLPGAPGAPRTTAGGLAIERTWLRSIGVDPRTTTLADGSGLSQYDRITPRDLVAIAQHDWNGPERDLVLGSLPIGGLRGTIEGIAGTGAAGRVFAKTGSMSHVRGLAGYLSPHRHRAVTFAFMVDDWNGDYASLAALRAKVLARIVDD